ncbi:MAG: EutN/CcmL family microcompartment protein [Thermoguttaceae bacterium]|jgi:microcompartment protein CcmK/EutM
MRIGQVIGKVVLSSAHPSLIGAQFKIVRPLTFEDLADPDPIEAANETIADADRRNLGVEERVDEAANRLANSSIPRTVGSELVLYDDCSAAIGEWLAFSEGSEAAAPFGRENPRPVDAFGGAIIDRIEIDAQVVAELAAARGE